MFLNVLMGGFQKVWGHWHWKKLSFKVCIMHKMKKLKLVGIFQTRTVVIVTVTALFMKWRRRRLGFGRCYVQIRGAVRGFSCKILSWWCEVVGLRGGWHASLRHFHCGYHFFKGKFILYLRLKTVIYVRGFLWQITCTQNWAMAT